MPATAHMSYWQETAGGLASHFPPLETDIDVDVAILGGGITGLTAAMHLQRIGRRVAVLEAGQIGCGTTGFTSGHLDATTDLALSRMIFEYGESAASVITTATREAIDQIEARCSPWPDCEFRRIPSYRNALSVLSVYVQTLGIIVAAVWIGRWWAYVLAFVLMGTLVSRVGSSRASFATYLIPVVALVLGAVFLDESVRALSILGIVLVIAGAVLASRKEPGA